jgi:DNA-nicking Smr family endonuclease
VIKKKSTPHEDFKTWENYIRNPSNIYDKEEGNNANNPRRQRFKFDLHGFTLDEANTKVKKLILLCSRDRYKEILFITGKGLHSTTDDDTYVSKELSKLKFSVPEYIKNNKELSDRIISITEAEEGDGGKGAILIRLKNL